MQTAPDKMPSDPDKTPSPRLLQSKIAKTVRVLPRLEAAHANGWRWSELVPFARDLLDEPDLSLVQLNKLVERARRAVAEQSQQDPKN